MGLLLSSLYALSTPTYVCRIDPWASYVLPPPESEGYVYNHHFWNPPKDKVIKLIISCLTMNKDISTRILSLRSTP